MTENEYTQARNYGLLAAIREIAGQIMTDDAGTYGVTHSQRAAIYNAAQISVETTLEKIGQLEESE
jgi:hypothetical protein